MAAELPGPEISITPANPSTTVELAKLVFDKLGESGISTLTKGLDATTKVADRGVISFLLGSGVLLAFCCLAFKLKIGENKLSDLTTGEFVTVFIVAMLLMMMGAGLRMWTYTSEYNLRRDESRVRLKVFETATGMAEKGMQASSEIAQSNAEIAKAQISAGAKTTEAAIHAAQPGHAATEMGSEVGDPGKL